MIKLKSLLKENEHMSMVFRNQSSVDSYLDMRDFFRKQLGEENESNTAKQLQLFDNAKKMLVDVTDIIPNQDYLDTEVISKYQISKNKLPLGVMFKEYVVIFDGHHRIAADIQNGSTKIEMLILKAFEIATKFDWTGIDTPGDPTM
jgi:hypothetical protein